MTKIWAVTGVAATALAVGAWAKVSTVQVRVAAKPGQVTALPATAPKPMFGMSASWPLTSSTASAMTATIATATTLAPLDLADMRLWNWGGKWHGSEWGNPESPIAWRYDHVRQPNGRDTILTIDAAGAPELQAMGGIEARSDGLWETEVTLPPLRDGMIVAPLWLYDPASKDEIDFEFAGRKGLDVTMHVYPGGIHQQNTVRLFPGIDFSGRRKRFGIKVDQTQGTVDMLVDGQRVHRWERRAMSYFVSRPMRPWIEMWAANPANSNYVQWAGAWGGLNAGEALAMTVHGYGYASLR